MQDFNPAQVLKARSNWGLPQQSGDLELKDYAQGKQPTNCKHWTVNFFVASVPFRPQAGWSFKRLPSADGDRFLFLNPGAAFIRKLIHLPRAELNDPFRVPSYCFYVPFSIDTCQTQAGLTPPG